MSSRSNDHAGSSLEYFPPGFRFCPTDVELICQYLQIKIEGKPLPLIKIHEVDLYKDNPECLSGKYEKCNEKEWYFFTPRDRKYKNGSRPSRSTVGGYWKATGADKSITDDGNIVGSKRALVFYKGKPPKGEKTNWIMHEYMIAGPPRNQENENDMKDDCVLCKIYKKEKPEGQEDEDMNETVIEAAPAEPELSVSDGKTCTQHFQQQALDLQVEDGSLQEAAPELERPEYFQQQEQNLLYFDDEVPQLDLMDSTLPSSDNAFSTFNETTSQYQQLSSMDEVLIPPNQMMQSCLLPLPDQMMQSVPTYESSSLNHHYPNNQQCSSIQPHVPSHVQSSLQDEDDETLQALIDNFCASPRQTLDDIDPK